MSVPGVWPQVLDFFGTPHVIEPPSGQLSSDAGLLPIRQFDEGIRLTWAYAEAVDGPRAVGHPEHSLSERARPRVFGILAGYPYRDGHGKRLDSSAAPRSGPGGKEQE
jgi:hypothetical protein